MLKVLQIIEEFVSHHSVALTVLVVGIATLGFIGWAAVGSSNSRRGSPGSFWLSFVLSGMLGVIAVYLGIVQLL